MDDMVLLSIGRQVLELSIQREGLIRENAALKQQLEAANVKLAETVKEPDVS